MGWAYLRVLTSFAGGQGVFGGYILSRDDRECGVSVQPNKRIIAMQEQLKKDEKGSCSSNAPKTGSCGTEAKKVETSGSCSTNTGSCGSTKEKSGSCSG